MSVQNCQEAAVAAWVWSFFICRYMYIIIYIYYYYYNGYLSAFLSVQAQGSIVYVFSHLDTLSSDTLAQSSMQGPGAHTKSLCTLVKREVFLQRHWCGEHHGYLIISSQQTQKSGLLRVLAAKVWNR